MIEEQKRAKAETVQNIFLGMLGIALIIKIFIPMFEYVMDFAAVGLVSTLIYKAVQEKHTGKTMFYSLLLLLIFTLIYTHRFQ
ncbi:hypothetical protein [Macrococcoides canis]|uniref:hypothetical protein n=1 Tax=Macrococcoides canis TaxID=1855823 RepID=UPI0020B8CE96|nr:hypothetical protein [Macrococcus canis]UTH01813.1 hypothetical protein KFV05_08825 [Macrococcus canis]UTH06271.1 hypothetical protein KFV07_08795 [Macrococcus canis]UTH08608.1 hypothetical protein KFV08_08775 [Macrococcus canis]